MTEMKTPLRKPALILLAACFFLSALSRVGNPEGALAYEVQRLTEAEASQQSLAPFATEDATPLIVAVRQREVQLDERELKLAERSKIIEAAEVKLKAQLKDLEQAEARLSELIRIADKSAERDVDKLIAVYQSMAGKSAAPIFETMDASFAAGLLSRMDGEPAAAILASMSPEKAYEVTVMIASQSARAPD